MTSVIFIKHKNPAEAGFSYSVAATAAPVPAKGLMLGRERPKQRVILARLLGGRELDTVRDEAHLRTLFTNKVTHLNQLLSKDLRRRDQRLQGVDGLVTTFSYTGHRPV